MVCAELLLESCFDHEIPGWPAQSLDRQPNGCAPAEVLIVGAHASRINTASLGMTEARIALSGYSFTTENEVNPGEAELNLTYRCSLQTHKPRTLYAE